ncbi:GDP-fucose protein O-fucosyltransferase [Gossypium australe]|uniref:GDP-fucose protein O-fucosyltransferase n=1 Tax=Gossypium australe TaxID=47621 RepID=A0A5B6X147_9ROSI|nr:GDP-fucose protein O-fucosyltransferase [Gossypium australe]
MEMLEMEDWKPGFEEEKALVEWSSIGDIRAEKLKNWVNKAIKMDKIKRLVVSKSPGCDRFRLWMVGITKTMLLQWVLSSQSGDDIGTITAKVEAPPYFPPPSIYGLSFSINVSQGDYKNQGYLMVSCNGGLNQMRADVRIIKHLPPRLRKKVETDGLYSMFPASLLLQHGELSHTAVVIPEKFNRQW